MHICSWCSDAKFTIVFSKIFENSKLVKKSSLGCNFLMFDTLEALPWYLTPYTTLSWHHYILSSFNTRKIRTTHSFTMKPFSNFILFTFDDLWCSVFLISHFCTYDIQDNLGLSWNAFPSAMKNWKSYDWYHVNSDLQ